MAELAEIQALLANHSLVRGVDRLPKGHIRIETGLLYPEGSSIEVFLSSDGPLFHGVKLTDLGQTASWLLDVQVKPWLSKKRQQYLDDAIELYGVKQNGGALEYPLENLGGLPDGVVRLGQACLRVADLSFTRRSSLQTVFGEEVEEVLVDADFPYEPNVELEGRFKKPVRVDYLVRGRKSASAVLLLSSGNASTAHATANEIFRRWWDLDIPERQEQRVTLFDDTKDVYREEDLARLETFSVVVPFSDRSTLLDLIAA